MWSNSLEPAYRTETERRLAEAQQAEAQQAEAQQAGGQRAGDPSRGSGRPRRPPRRSSALGALALAAAGLLLATAAAQVQRGAPSAAQAREALLGQVQRRTAISDALAAEVTATQAALAAERDAALAQDRDTRALAARVAELELLAGATPVTGPGIRVTLDDAPPRSDDALAPDAAVPSEVQEGRLLDRDLAEVVNALWAAGAEAVAVEGQRLSALSAISNAGDAVLVDFRPATPPYVVEAIGDPARLEPAFVDSPAGRRFATYVSLLGITFDVTAEDRLALPAAALRVDSTGAEGEVVDGTGADGVAAPAPAGSA